MSEPAANSSHNLAQLFAKASAISMAATSGLLLVATFLPTFAYLIIWCAGFALYIFVIQRVVAPLWEQMPHGFLRDCVQVIGWWTGAVLLLLGAAVIWHTFNQVFA